MPTLLLPGWQNSGIGHWQTQWEALYGDQRVQQHDWDWPRRGDWMARLDEVLLDSDEPAVLVAHSLAVGRGVNPLGEDGAQQPDQHRAPVVLEGALPGTLLAEQVEIDVGDCELRVLLEPGTLSQLAAVLEDAGLPVPG